MKTLTITKQVVGLFFILLCMIQLQAQEKTISGTISDENGLPMPGVSILVKGTSNGTQTDFDGNYTIKTHLGDVIRYSSIGYLTVDKTVGTSNNISFNMKVDTSALEEVVITAMSIKRKRDNVTHAYQSVNINSQGYRGSGSTRKRTKKEKITTATQLLKSNSNKVVKPLPGKGSGLQIARNTNNNAKNDTRIVLRGNRSINETNEALIVIDGRVSTKAELDKLKAKKVKEIKVLKGATGSALYGSQGGNGVIIVKTKKSSYTMPKDADILRIENESYTKIHENKFKRAVLEPLSTFSIDVDKASYSNVRRLINNGQFVPADAVKIEEMVNYFNYNYPQPKGEHPFSINTEVAKTPWNKDTKLVKVGLQGKTYKNEALPASNLTFLIDVSGSMHSTKKLPLLKSAFKLLVNQLRDKDNVAIVVYAGAAGVVLEPTSGRNKDVIIKALDNLRAGGSTAGGQGIELAYKLAQQHFKKGGNNRVILATDGDFNVGASSNEAMEKLIVEKRKTGVFLSVLGFGYGNYKDSKLETLADRGNGNHAYIDTMQEAKLIFGKEFGGTLFTIAKDVKIQVEFNPAKVQAYRLIGYENRLLANEDFVDDTKDAGELGSGHNVTALYEVIPVGSKSDYLKEVTNLKYTKTKMTDAFADELMTVKFRYKKPDGDKSIELIQITKDEVTEASEDMKFAASVALFGMQLRASQFHNNSKIEDVIALAEAGRGDDKDGYRAEFIRLISTVK
ncbi:YfbK domain-containing protein [Pontimicrobium sp. MEBiC01747]